MLSTVRLSTLLWVASTLLALVAPVPALAAGVEATRAESSLVATAVTYWSGGLLVAGRTITYPGPGRRECVWRQWLAEVEGLAVRPLAWPPSYLNMPTEHSIRFCGEVGSRVAVVVEANHHRQPFCRLLLWDGRDWEMFPRVEGSIHRVVEHDGHLIIGGGFRINANAALAVMQWVDGRWLPLGGGLPEARGVIDLIPWRGGLVAVSGSRAPLPAAERCLWEWRHGAWSPKGPTFGGWQGVWLNAIVWNDRLVIAGHFSRVDGEPSSGMVLLDANGRSEVPPPPRESPLLSQWNAQTLAIWDGRLVAAPMSWHANASMLKIVDDVAAVPFPGMPEGGGPFWPGQLSARGRELAAVSSRTFAAGATEGHDQMDYQLAGWRDGSWWTPPLTALREP